MPKTLYIFDMGGVVTTTAALSGRVSRIIGMDDDEFERICTGQGSGEDNIFTQCSDGVIDTKGFWTEFTKRSGIKVKTDWFKWLFHPVTNTDTVRIVKILREQGNRVVCGTNTISCHFQTHMERGDYSIFDQTYSSCNMGVSKPDSDFWNIILEAEGAAPADCVFIDDRQDNCDAAAALGIRAICFTDALTLAKELGVAL